MKKILLDHYYVGWNDGGCAGSISLSFENVPHSKSLAFVGYMADAAAHWDETCDPAILKDLKNISTD